MLLHIRLVGNDTSILADEITLIINLSNSRQHSLLQPFARVDQRVQRVGHFFLLTCFMLPLLEYYLIHKLRVSLNLQRLLCGDLTRRVL